MAEPEDGGQFNRITSVADILNQQAIRASSTQEATGETPKFRGMSDRYLSLIHRGHVGTVYVADARSRPRRASLLWCPSYPAVRSCSRSAKGLVEAKKARTAKQCRPSPFSGLRGRGRWNKQRVALQAADVNGAHPRPVNRLDTRIRVFVCATGGGLHV